MSRDEEMPDKTKALDECYIRCNQISAFYGWLATEGLGLGIISTVIAIYGGLWQIAMAIAAIYISLLLSISRWSRACWGKYDMIKNQKTGHD